jgi:hypothetical protein
MTNPAALFLTILSLIICASIQHAHAQAPQPQGLQPRVPASNNAPTPAPVQPVTVGNLKLQRERYTLRLDELRLLREQTKKELDDETKKQQTSALAPPTKTKPGRAVAEPTKSAGLTVGTTSLLQRELQAKLAAIDKETSSVRDARKGIDLEIKRQNTR